MCLVDSIKKRPKNARELANQFCIDYSTARHSLRVLEKNRIIYSEDKKYGAKYKIAPEFEGMLEEYDALKKHNVCDKGCDA
jgi:predicted transcriptional regulator